MNLHPSPVPGQPPLPHNHARYDSLNRLIGKSYSNGQGVVTYEYDQGGAAAFALGRLTKVIDPSGSETYTYDRGGRVTQVQKVIGTTTYPIGYQYNPGGQVTQVTYPSGRTVQRTPDNIGRLSVISDTLSGTTTTRASGFTYNSSGQTLAFTYGNGVVANFSYSAARRQMTSLSYTKGAQTLFRLNYFYQKDPSYCPGGINGNDGQINCITDGVDSGRTVGYTYDAVNRLSTAETIGSTAYPKWGLSWTYDRYGNRLRQDQTAGAPPYNILSFGTTPGAGAYTNRPDGYPFDASGNMLNDGDNTLVHDAENCLTSNANPSTGTTTYTCDSNRIRVKKALQGGTTTVYVFAWRKVIAEYDMNAPVGSPSREYYLFGRRTGCDDPGRDNDLSSQ